MDKLLYRVEDAAEVLSLSRAKLYEYIARQELPVQKFGGSTRIHADDLKAFARRESREPAGSTAA
jgi:excisionase family DNA binding protein